MGGSRKCQFAPWPLSWFWLLSSSWFGRLASLLAAGRAERESTTDSKLIAAAAAAAAPRISCPSLEEWGARRELQIFRRSRHLGLAVLRALRPTTSRLDDLDVRAPWQLATPFPQTPKHSGRAFSALNKSARRPWTARALASHNRHVLWAVSHPHCRFRTPPAF